jgi:hypothetical protein
LRLTKHGNAFFGIGQCYGLRRGYHYHTGIVFAAYVPGPGQALANGGRYDNVGAVFGRARAATGFATDLKALLALVPAEAGSCGAISMPDSDDAALAQRVNDALAIEDPDALYAALAALRQQRQARYADLPKFATGTRAQANSKAVDGEGRIRHDNTAALLHKGEVVLNAKQVKQAEEAGWPGFKEGSKPRLAPSIVEVRGEDAPPPVLPGTNDDFYDYAADWSHYDPAKYTQAPKADVVAATLAERVEIGPLPSGNDDDVVMPLLEAFNTARARSTEPAVVAPLLAPLAARSPPTSSIAVLTASRRIWRMPRITRAGTPLPWRGRARRPMWPRCWPRGGPSWPSVPSPRSPVAPPPTEASSCRRRD